MIGGFPKRAESVWDKLRSAVFAFAVVSQLAVWVNASDQIPAPPQDHPIALVGATIHTVSGPILPTGTVLFDGGKIIALGGRLDLPSGTEEIDIRGKHVYPGLIAAHSIIGLVEIEQIRSTRDAVEVGEIKPNVRAEVAFNPDSEILPVTRANGITLALSVPGGGAISGTSALMMLDGWTWEAMTLKAPVGLHVRWPRMHVRQSPFASSPEEQQKRWEKQIELIRAAFTEARSYLKAKEAEGLSGVPYHDSDLRWDAMIPVLKGEIPVMLHANDIRQIQAAVDWATEEGVKVVLVGGRDAWQVTDLLKEKDIAVIIDGVHTIPARRWEGYDTPFTNALKLYQAGVRFCISDGGGAANERNLPYHAATAAAYGLPKEEALKAVTLYPAQILGVADRVGSIEVGKDATLIVTDGDPLEITTHVEREFIQGRDIDLSSHHTQLYGKYQAKYQQLQ